MAEPAAVVCVGAARAWEIAAKVGVGKLPGAVEVAERLPTILADQSFNPLPMGVEHARRAGLMPGEHRDSFDRISVSKG